MNDEGGIRIGGGRGEFVEEKVFEKGDGDGFRGFGELGGEGKGFRKGYERSYVF